MLPYLTKRLNKRLIIPILQGSVLKLCCSLTITHSYLGRHVGEQEGLVAVFLTLSMVPGCGEMAAVETAVLEVGVLKEAVQSLLTLGGPYVQRISAPLGPFQIYSLVASTCGDCTF